jgi:hypothetical protein
MRVDVLQTAERGFHHRPADAAQTVVGMDDDVVDRSVVAAVRQHERGAYHLFA